MFDENMIKNWKESWTDSLNEGPRFVFGYEMPVVGDGIIRLTYNGESTPIISTVTGIEKTLNHFHEHNKDKCKEGDIKFLTHIIYPTNNNTYHSDEANPILAVACGISKDYFNRPYNGATEAMYLADDLGLMILNESLKHGLTPAWGYADYNWNCCLGGDGVFTQTEKYTNLIKRLKEKSTIQTRQ